MAARGVKRPKFFLQIREYPNEKRLPYLSVWLIRRDGAVTSSLLFGQMDKALTEEVAGVLGLAVEREECPFTLPADDPEVKDYEKNPARAKVQQATLLLCEQCLSDINRKSPLLAAEREARLRAEQNNKDSQHFAAELESNIKFLNERVEQEWAARLRAEAGAAVMRKALEGAATADNYGGDQDLWMPQVEAALQADTGAALAAVVEEARKKGCIQLSYGLGNRSCNELWCDNKSKWCTNCKLVAATGGDDDTTAGD